MASQFRPRPMPLSDEEFARQMRMEEQLKQGIVLGDGAGAAGSETARYEAQRPMPTFNSGNASTDMPQAAPITPNISEGIAPSDIINAVKAGNKKREEERRRKEAEIEAALEPQPEFALPDISEYRPPNWSDHMPGGTASGQVQQPPQLQVPRPGPAGQAPQHQSPARSNQPQAEGYGTWRVSGKDSPPLSDEAFERKIREEERRKGNGLWEQIFRWPDDDGSSDNWRDNNPFWDEPEDRRDKAPSWDGRDSWSDYQGVRTLLNTFEEPVSGSDDPRLLRAEPVSRGPARNAYREARLSVRGRRGKKQG